jgi:hypothetical protein
LPSTAIPCIMEGSTVDDDRHPWLCL